MKNVRKIAAIWCLTSLLVGQVVQAKTLLIYPYQTGAEGSTNLGPRDGINQTERNVRCVTNIIRLTGGDVSIVRADNVRTEWARTGKMVWGRDASQTTSGVGGYEEQFNAVIALGNYSTNAIKTGMFKSDSLSRTRRQGGSTVSGNAVPMLRLMTNAENVVAGASRITSYDSAGVYSTAAENGNGIAAFTPNDPFSTFLTMSFTQPFVYKYNTGFLRKILYAGTPQIEYRWSNGVNSGARQACRTCDSLLTYAESDSLLMWDLQYGSVLGQGSTITYLSAFGAGCAADSISADGTSGCPGTEGDWQIVLAGLAHLDSLSGGNVLGKKVIKIAPIVYGGLSRGERHAWKSPGSAQGILGADTSAFYETLDSLNALNIPITFAINPDSASSYERDLIKMKQVKSARFTPQIWNGISDSTKAGGQNAAYRPVDVYGRYRNRTAVGDFSGVGGDSSIATLAKSALRLTDSLTSGRVSRIAVAPDDDWSPLNTEGVLVGTNRVPIDSVLYALSRAGFVGVVADAQDPDANASKRGSGPSKTNPRGYYNRQGLFTSASIPTLRGFKILTHSGYNIMGGKAQAVTLDAATALLPDSTTSSLNGPNMIYRGLGRLWSSALLDVEESYDLFPYDEVIVNGNRAMDNIWQRKVDRIGYGWPNQVIKGNVYRISCSELSGASGQTPARTAYHVLKSAAAAMRVINKLAGRTVVMFAYPEDIEP